jgi:hypothetical protein
MLNAVAVENLEKSIAMSKEVFDCYDAHSTLTQVKDVETFIELTESGTAKKGYYSTTKWGKKPPPPPPPGFTALTKSVTVDTCVKDLQKGTVACKSADMPLGTTTAPLSKCTLTKGTYPFPTIVQPTHPVQMSTVVLANGLVKTVKVEEEVFDCSGQIGDVYVFTDVGELAGDKGFSSLGTTFQGVICLKDESTATVVSCKLFTPSRAS